MQLNQVKCEYATDFLAYFKGHY